MFFGDGVEKKMEEEEEKGAFRNGSKEERCVMIYKGEGGNMDEGTYNKWIYCH